MVSPRRLLLFVVSGSSLFLEQSQEHGVIIIYGRSWIMVRSNRVNQPLLSSQAYLSPPINRPNVWLVWLQIVYRTGHYQTRLLGNDLQARLQEGCGGKVNIKMAAWLIGIYSKRICRQSRVLEGLAVMVIRLKVLKAVDCTYGKDICSRYEYEAK